MRLVAKAHRRGLELPVALDVDPFVRVDQDVRDRRILEDRLDRAEYRELVDDLVDEIAYLLRVERNALGRDVLADEILDLMLQLGARNSLDVRQVELVDQAVVQSHLRFEELGGLQQAGLSRILALDRAGDVSAAWGPLGTAVSVVPREAHRRSPNG